MCADSESKVNLPRRVLTQLRLAMHHKILCTQEIYFFLPFLLLVGTAEAEPFDTTLSARLLLAVPPLLSRLTVAICLF